METYLSRLLLLTSTTWSSTLAATLRNIPYIPITFVALPLQKDSGLDFLLSQRILFPAASTFPRTRPMQQIRHLIVQKRS